MKKSESIVELAKAMTKFQTEVIQPTKSKVNPFHKSKYVPLENVIESIIHTARAHGLSFMQFPLNEMSEKIVKGKDGTETIEQIHKVGVYTLVMHDSGEWIESDPIFATPTKQDAQGVGSVVTYLKRYSLSAIFGINSENDDDGNKATGIGHKDRKIDYEDFNEVLKMASEKSGVPQKDLYVEISNALGINKPTKDLLIAERKAIISLLIKKINELEF